MIRASLYVPATRKDMTTVALGRKYPFLKSVVLCTEDSILEREVETAIGNLSQLLPRISRHREPACFVRPRTPAVLRKILSLEGAENLSGFVIPKVTPENLDEWLAVLGNEDFWIMPTLESQQTFCERSMVELRQMFLRPDVRHRILALRIGGNDLLACLGMRRPRNATIYGTPLGLVIDRLVITFRPFGFRLTAPVFEHLDLPDLLRREITEDRNRGLCGKTAIHPAQVGIIEQGFHPRPEEIAAARRIVANEAPAVFRYGGSMCEVATHAAWAETLIRDAGAERCPYS